MVYCDIAHYHGYDCATSDPSEIREPFHAVSFQVMRYVRRGCGLGGGYCIVIQDIQDPKDPSCAVHYFSVSLW